MATGLTTTSIIADTIPTIIAAARHTEQYTPVIRQHCWVIKKPLHTGTTQNLPYWGTVAAGALTEGVDLSQPTKMADTNVQITPAEVGAQIIVTWKVVRDNQEDVLRAAGRILGNGFVAKQEQDLAAQFDDATTSLGASATALTLGHIAAAWALLKGLAIASGGPAPEPYGVFHHPYVLLDIVDVLTPLLATTTATYQGITGAGGIADEVLRNGLKGELFGMPVFSSGNISISGTDVKGAVLAMGEGGGLACVISQEWDIFPQDDASLRATELNVVGEYGVGEYLAGWIVELYNDATTPA